MSDKRQPVRRTDTLVIRIENGRWAQVRWRDLDGKEWDALCPLEVYEDGELMNKQPGA